MAIRPPDVLHISVRERELLDRVELDHDESAEVLAEIDELRAARGRGPRGEDQRP